MRFFTRLLYAPLFFIFFIGGGLWLTQTGGAGHTLALIPLFLFAVFISFAAESWQPFDQAWNMDKGDFARDMAHFLVNQGMAVVVAGLPFLSYYLGHPQFWPTNWPIWAQVMFAIIVADFGITLGHWASHRIPFLWRLHEVHHSVTRMYGFNGLMKHPLHLTLEGLCGFGLLIVLGIPFEIAAMVSYAIAIQLLLQHSNFDMEIGPLRYIFAWAPLHRIHHVRYGKSGDVNFALFFSFWDHMLGTAFFTDKHRLTTADLGIGSRPDYPIGYAAELIEPFVPVRNSVKDPEPPCWLIA